VVEGVQRQPFLYRLLARGLFDEPKAAQGSIINVTSIAGSKVHPFAGVAYATSKAALSALTREMAYDFGPHGVRVNAIAPGEIDTAILSPGTTDIVERLVPMNRLQTGGSRLADLLPLHQRRFLRERSGNSR
jgi:NAD(P)-dependent dehydrogenase (short-subunit alcohol dehydrogenase family)